MKAIFILKAFEDAVTWPDDGELAKQIWFVDVDKFVLCALNWLIYNREIIGPLAASFFLELPKYYTLQRFIRRINLYSLQYKIALLLFLEKVDTDLSDQVVPLDWFQRFLLSMFENYQ